jgi:hypothetical protein
VTYADDYYPVVEHEAARPVDATIREVPIPHIHMIL